jgi:hypothetical protein
MTNPSETPIDDISERDATTATTSTVDEGHDDDQPWLDPVPDVEEAM